MSKIFYRYDNEDYADGRIVRSRGDSFNMLTDVEKIVELKIRELPPRRREHPRYVFVYLGG